MESKQHVRCSQCASVFASTDISCPVCNSKSFIPFDQGENKQLNTQKITITDKKRKAKYFSWDVLIVPATLVSIFVFTLSKPINDRIVGVVILYLMGTALYFMIRVAFIETLWTKHISKLIQQLKILHGFNDLKTPEVVSIFKHKKDELLFNQNHCNFFLATYSDTKESCDHILLHIFNRSEIDGYNIQIEPPALSRLLPRERESSNKFGVAGALQYGVGGVIIGSVVDGLLSELRDMREKKIKISAILSFYKGQQMLLEYNPIMINQSFDKKAAERVIKDTMAELQKAENKLHDIFKH